MAVPPKEPGTARSWNRLWAQLNPLPSAVRRWFSDPASVFVVTAAVIGVALRGWILLSPRLGALDQDESVAGLMALHFARGEFTAFFWGQPYGGTLEILLAAGLFKLLGFSVLLPKVVTIGLHAVGAWLVWLIGVRVLDRQGAVIAAALAWTWPTFAVWKSNRLLGFYAMSLVLVLLIILLVMRIWEKPTRIGMLLIGAMVGLGWWTNPATIFAAVPAALWLIYHRPPLLRMSALVAAGALVGSLPWLWSNLIGDWRSLGVVAVNDSVMRYFDALRGLFVQPVPSALGLRVPGSPNWVLGPIVGIVLYVLLILALAFAWRKRSTLTGLLYAVLIGYLLILAITQHSLYRAEPRYLYIMMPLLAMLVVNVATRMRVQLLLPAILVALSVVGLYSMSQFPKDRIVPANFSPLIGALDESDIERVFAFHQIAYRLSFESGERVIATAIDHVRYIPYDRAVRDSAKASYVFAPEPDVSEAFQSELDARGIAYSTMVAGDFLVLTPEATVLPEGFESLILPD